MSYSEPTQDGLDKILNGNRFSTIPHCESDPEKIPEHTGVIPGITSAFRHRPVLEELTRAVGKLSKTKPVDVLFAGCSIGLEPVSFAIHASISKVFEEATHSISITAIDRSEHYIEQARRSEYTKILLMGLTTKEYAFLNRSTNDRNTFVVKPEITQLINFQTKDIFQSDNNEQYDFVVASNLLIYYSQSALAKCFSRLAEKTKDSLLFNVRHGEEDKHKAIIHKAISQNGIQPNGTTIEKTEIIDEVAFSSPVKFLVTGPILK